MTVDQARARYAQEIRTSSAIQSEALVTALSRVPRERFVGKGPWFFPSKESWLAGGPRYQQRTGDDPCLVYQNSAIALDPRRDLTNGHPGTVASWIDALDIQRGDRVLHVGCGTGYYTAIMAEMVGPHGQVLGVDVDRTLVRRAARCLKKYDQVTVREVDATCLDPGPVDRILVSLGVMLPAAMWLDRLSRGGRMILPLTFAIPNVSLTKGATFCIIHDEAGFRVRYHSFTLIYGDVSRCHSPLNDILHERYRQGGWQQVRSLRRDTHLPHASCWFHAPGCCFSTTVLNGLDGRDDPL